MNMKKDFITNLDLAFNTGQYRSCLDIQLEDGNMADIIITNANYSFWAIFQVIEDSEDFHQKKDTFNAPIGVIMFLNTFTYLRHKDEIPPGIGVYVQLEKKSLPNRMKKELSQLVKNSCIDDINAIDSLDEIISSENIDDTPSIERVEEDIWPLYA